MVIIMLLQHFIIIFIIFTAYTLKFREKSHFNLNSDTKMISNKKAFEFVFSIYNANYLSYISLSGLLWVLINIDPIRTNIAIYPHNQSHWFNLQAFVGSAQRAYPPDTIVWIRYWTSPRSKVEGAYKRSSYKILRNSREFSDPTNVGYHSLPSDSTAFGSRFLSHKLCMIYSNIYIYVYIYYSRFIKI